MRWSKLNKLVENNFASIFQGRIALNSTRYGNCSCGHAWITYDKKVIANFCTRAYFNRFGFRKDEWYDFGAPDSANKEKYKKLLNEYGDLTRFDFYNSCWDYVHSSSILDALSSDNLVLQMLAVIDKKMGKRRLATIDKMTLHPLARFLLNERCASH